MEILNYILVALVLMITFLWVASEWRLKQTKFHLRMAEGVVLVLAGTLECNGITVDPEEVIRLAGGLVDKNMV